MKFDLLSKMKNMSLRSKRILALSVCVLLLGAAIVQNIRSGSSTAVKPGEDMSLEGESDMLPELVGVSKIEDSEEYFAQQRLNRLNTQSVLTEEYQNVIDDTSAEEDAVAEAEEMLTALNEVMMHENDLEVQIKSMGYQDVFASLELDGDVDIIILTQSLNEADVNTIAQLVCDVTQISVDQITVRGVADIN